MVGTLEKILNKDDCANLRSVFDLAVKNDKVKIWRDDKSSDVRIFNAERKLSEFKPLFEKMVGIYVAENGKRPNHCFLMVNRVIPVVGNLGSGGGWHRDTWFNQHKVFVFLSDVNDDNGPFEYLPGTGTVIAKMKDFARTGRSLRVKEEHVQGKPSVALVTQEGHGIYFDTTVLHRGRPIQNGIRYAATLYAFSQSGKKLAKSRERFDIM